MRGVVTLVVAASLLLAGCGGFAAEEAPATEDTVTPVPVPSTTPTSAADAPPGVSATGVDHVVVAERHERALANETYTLTATVEWTGPNGTNHTSRFDMQTDGTTGQYAFSEEYAHPRGSYNRTAYDVWYDGDRALARTAFVTGPAEYHEYAAPTADADAAAPFLRDLLAGLSVDRVDTRDDGATVVSGSLDPIASLNRPRHARALTNGSTSVRIHPDGYVERLVVGYDAEFDESTVRVREELTITDVGETTVTEPGWVANRTK